MENASKALIIAGSILIAIIIITIMLYAFSSYRNLARTQEETAEIEEITAFNRQYEMYNKQNLYGAEVISLINKAKDNNAKYNSSDLQYVNVDISDTEENKITEAEELKDKKSLAFKCTGVEYNNKGRICKITIEQQ